MPNKNFPYLTDEFFSNYNVTINSFPNSKDSRITITLPASQLNALAKIESVFYNNLHNPEIRTIFHDWLSNCIYEEELREENPALNEAYEKYKLVLSLTSEKLNKNNNLQ